MGSDGSTSPPFLGVAPRAPYRRALWDEVARAGVTIVGVAVIASILALLVFLLVEIAPLFGGADVEAGIALPVSAPGRGLLLDDQRTHAAWLGTDGSARVLRLRDGAIVATTHVEGVSLPLRTFADPIGETLIGLDHSGRVLLVPIDSASEWQGGTRSVSVTLGEPSRFSLMDGAELAEPSVHVFAARGGRGGDATIVAQLAGGELRVVRRAIERNPFLGSEHESIERSSLEPVSPLTALVLGPDGRFVYGGSEKGELFSWDLSDASGRASDSVPTGSPVSALNLLNGGRALVVGGAEGRVSIWFRIPGDGPGDASLTWIRDLGHHDAAIRSIAPSLRDRSFLVQDRDGGLGLYHSTSGRTLWIGRAPLAGARALAFAPRGNGALVLGDRALSVLSIRNPHPELSFQALLGKVWYEGARGPAWVWQSTGGSDEFEPKLSLVPLIVGTLKGTLYSLLFAVPLAILGAIYTSHFVDPSLRRVFKPAVELMASLPSVVLGFLAGLWLAPRLEQVLAAGLLAIVAIPVSLLVFGNLWPRLPERLRDRLPRGAEIGAFALAILAGLATVTALGPELERLAFGGSMTTWLREAFGVRYDQRNAIVVGLAMGFAVVPIIFTIAEDALSNVPRDLVAGSRALGATPWQTVLRIVIPTASPGVFAGVMIGFGRAVGETMIVLMATGNTPILDWSPFDGFRTLSATIAVEIPEAPEGATLYRTLFVAALLLFALTFLVNTAAELIRSRLRERYARL